jgi:glycosyltransferase involved in cell wall biosynthesis
LNINSKKVTSENTNIYIVCNRFDIDESFKIKKLLIGSKKDLQEHLNGERYNSDKSVSKIKLCDKEIISDVKDMDGLITDLRHVKKITHIHISTDIRPFISELHIRSFIARHNLRIYESKEKYDNVCNDSVLFIGMFNDTDLEMLKNHIGLKFLLWCESDTDDRIAKYKNYMKLISGFTDTFHFVYSSRSYYSLKKNNIKATNIKSVIPYNRTSILGKIIYVYDGIENDNITYISPFIEKGLEDGVKNRYNYVSSSEMIYECDDNIALVINIKSDDNDDGEISNDTKEDIMRYYRKCIPVISVASIDDRFMKANSLNDAYQIVHKYINNMHYYNRRLRNIDKLVTIIMTTYNREDKVCNAIDSILNQSHKKLKLIVIDDASTDKTLKILGKYSKNKKVTIVRNKINSGTYYCKNLGLSLMDPETEYYAFQDSDDISHPNRIQTHLNEMVNNELDFTISLMSRGDVLRLAYISMFFHVSIFKDKLGYFDDDTRFGADSEYIYRYFRYDGLDMNTIHYILDIHNTEKELEDNIKFKYIPVMLYFIGDSDEEKLTTIYPIGKQLRREYIKKYKKRICNADKIDLYRSFTDKGKWEVII